MLVDLDVRSGLYKRDLPYTVGGDAVGTLVHIPSLQSTSISGPDQSLLSKLAIGQKVFTNAGYMVAPWWKVAIMPNGMKDEDGIGMGTIGLTAMYLIKESYKVKESDWVLVRAAAGGVGLILCQVSFTLTRYQESLPYKISLENHENGEYRVE